MSVTFRVKRNGDFDVTDEVWEASPQVNCNGGNAGRILAVLGLPTDPWNLPLDFEDPTGVDFLGRVLLALAIEPQDEGMEMYATYTDTDRFQEGARHEGYMQDVLRELIKVGEYAVSHGRQVSWG